MMGACAQQLDSHPAQSTLCGVLNSCRQPCVAHWLLSTRCRDVHACWQHGQAPTHKLKNWSPPGRLQVELLTTRPPGPTVSELMVRSVGSVDTPEVSPARTEMAIELVPALDTSSAALPAARAGAGRHVLRLAPCLARTLGGRQAAAGSFSPCSSGVAAAEDGHFPILHFQVATTPRRLTSAILAIACHAQRWAVCGAGDVHTACHTEPQSVCSSVCCSVWGGRCVRHWVGVHANAASSRRQQRRHLALIILKLQV